MSGRYGHSQIAITTHNYNIYQILKMRQQPLKGIHDNVASFAVFFMFIYIAFFPSVSKAQQQKPQTLGVKYNDVFTILSPLPDSTIADGELFISLKFISTVELTNSGLRVIIDDRLVTTFIKINNHNLTVLYLLPLSAGEHNIEITAKEKGYQFFAPIKWRFYVRENKVVKTDSVIINPTGDTIIKPIPTVPVTLTGSIVLDSRQTKLSGPGAVNRQEPPQTNNANINVELKVGKVSFPLRIFQTSDELTKFYQPRGIQSRNYFQTGISHEKIELLWGDMSPSFDKLVLTGLKMRGYKFALNFKRFQLQAIRGQLARANEGLSDTGQHTNGIPNYGWVSNAPGSYIQPGTYERNMTGLRLVFGNKLEGTYLGLNFLKVKDNPNSIKYGVSPKDNFVVGADQTFSTNQSKMKGSVGWAYSFFTNDASKPAVTKKQIDSALGTDLKVDPYNFRNVFITNFTTVKPAKNAMSMYANLAFRPKNQVLTFDFRYFGAGYQSLGNPYLKVDVRQFSVQEQIYIFKRKMNLSVRYQFQDNNRSKTQYSTINQHFVTGTYLLAPGPKWPQLMVNYMLQNRRSSDLERQSKTLLSNDYVQTVTSSLIYTLRTGKSSHSINLQYTQNDRIDKINSLNNNNMKIYSAGFREQVAPLNLGIDVQFTKNLSTDPITRLPIPFSQSADTRLRYQYKKIRTTFSVGYIYSQMIANLYTLGSTRQTMNFNIMCNVVKNFTFELEGGKSPNRNISNPTGDYNETYIYGRVTHALGYKFR